MNTISINLPDSTLKQLDHVAGQQGISIQELVSSMLTQGAQIADATSIIETRAPRGNKARFIEILKSAPDIEPEEQDRQPEE